MKSRISELLEEIRVREEELEDAIKTHEVDFLYRLEGSKIKFEQAVEQAHRKIVLIYHLRWMHLDSFFRFFHVLIWSHAD